jgi:heme A synthase
MNKENLFARLALVATVLALCVVVLGAYVRLSHAGLGCPDWPGCYGHIGVPDTEHEVQAANALHPDRPVEAHKAWKEMIHRYFAGILGLLVFSLGFIAWRNRRNPDQQVKVPLFLSALIIFQALLGMWTVTIKLKPDESVPQIGGRDDSSRQIEKAGPGRIVDCCHAADARWLDQCQLCGVAMYRFPYLSGAMVARH